MIFMVNNDLFSLLHINNGFINSRYWSQCSVIKIDIWNNNRWASVIHEIKITSLCCYWSFDYHARRTRLLMGLDFCTRIWEGTKTSFFDKSLRFRRGNKKHWYKCTFSVSIYVNFHREHKKMEFIIMMIWRRITFPITPVIGMIDQKFNFFSIHEKGCEISMMTFNRIHWRIITS